MSRRRGKSRRLHCNIKSCIASFCLYRNNHAMNNHAMEYGRNGVPTTLALKTVIVEQRAGQEDVTSHTMEKIVLEKMGRNLVMVKKKKIKKHAIRNHAQTAGDPGVNIMIVIETVVEELSQERDSVIIHTDKERFNLSLYNSLIYFGSQYYTKTDRI